MTQPNKPKIGGRVMTKNYFTQFELGIITGFGCGFMVATSLVIAAFKTGILK